MDGSGLSSPRDRKDLKRRVMVRVGREERRRLALAALGFGAALMGSVALAVTGYFEVAGEAARSGFSAYASLAFSDFRAAAANFSDFAFSLVESFPVSSGILFSSGVFVAFWSAARFVNKMICMRDHRLFIFRP